jgi:hypothetical protein
MTALALHGAQDLIDLLPAPEARPPRASRPPRPVGEIGPADVIRSMEWEDILVPLGLTYVADSTVRGDPVELWVRDGASSPYSLKAHPGDGACTVFSDALGVPTGVGLSKFTAYAMLRHPGLDREDAEKAAAAEIRAVTNGQAVATDPTMARAAAILATPTLWGAEHDLGALLAPPAGNTSTGLPASPAGTVDPVLAQALANANLIDWSTAWDDDHEEAWVLYPLVPKGRSVDAYGANGVGKSEVIYAGIAAAVLGLPVYGCPATDPISVLVLDEEMGKPDSVLRLGWFGYGPEYAEALAARLHYAALPSFPPLDTQAGADQVLALALHLGVDLLVIDTFMKALEGGENDSDTFHAYVRLTANRLKAAGIAVLRLDHSGHDGTHQRGSSAKGGDPDVTWKVTRYHQGTRLEREKERVSWPPKVVQMVRTGEKADGTICYTFDRSTERAFGEFAQGDAAVLDALGVDPTAGRPRARKALDDAGVEMSNGRLAEAVRWRKLAVPTFSGRLWIPPEVGADSRADSQIQVRDGQVLGQVGTPTPENDTSPGTTSPPDSPADSSGQSTAGLCGQVGGSNEVTPHRQPPPSVPEQLPLDDVEDDS